MPPARPRAKQSGAGSRDRQGTGSGPAPGPAVEWRSGVHLRGTPIWCDARRPRDVCFVSCAHAAGASRHGQLIGTAATLALLGPEVGTRSARLSVPYGRPFTLGSIRLELLRSGHALGSAALLTEVAGRRLLYAGAVNPHGGGLGGAAELRPCDVLVLDATYAHPRYAFPPVERAVAAVRAFALEVATAGGVAALLVSSPSKGLDVIGRLSEEPHLGFAAHWSIHEAARRLRRGHAALPRVRRWSGRPPPGKVLLWPVEQRAALGALPGPSRVALVSGQAMDADVVAALGVDAAFAWSNRADHQELLGYVEQSGAQAVFATSVHAEDLARTATTATREVRALGPPRQMALFDS
jgi:putative mRNA 3-end processing factor